MFIELHDFIALLQLILTSHIFIEVKVRSKK